LLSSVLLVAASCAKHEAIPLRVGTNVWPGYESFYYASHLGLYKEHGIKIIAYPSTSETMNSIKSGLIEAAAMTLDEAALLASEGAPVKIVAVLDYSLGADVIIGGNGVKSMKDIKGRKVGVESTAVGAMVLIRGLAHSGMSLNDVRVVYKSYSQHEESLTSGAVDAVVTFEPVRSKLLAKGGKLLFDSSMIPGEIMDVLVVRKDVLESNPRAVEALLSGFFKAANMLLAGDDRAIEFMAAREGVDKETFIKGLKLIKILDAGENAFIMSGGDPAFVVHLKQMENMFIKNRLVHNPVKLVAMLEPAFMEKIGGEK